MDTISTNNAKQSKLNSTSLFSNRATNYVKYRPSYPAIAIQTILAGLGKPSSLITADIGAGTGIASRLLAEHGLRVVSIEPNYSMREAAEPHPFIEYSNATAEQTKLSDNSVDLVTCFQAFHWFQPTPTLKEFRRILKPSGRLALIWNQWVAENDFFTEFKRLIFEALPSDAPRGKQSKAMNPLWSSPNFRGIRCHKFMHRHELDLPGLIGYAQSKSFIPQAGDTQQKLVSNLQNLHAQWADDRSMVSLLYCTTVYLADPCTAKLNLSKLVPPSLLGKWRKLNQKTIEPL
ncbi:MAG: class I SAM-dependent methyltransferase [Chroococcus sp. CMT-3BRIN-NPC107]|nr:class I SAM-dependent methyltransferase [Chroococcus sp. CMT-3BRIN-NPC107]